MKTASMVLGLIASGMSIFFNFSMIIDPSYYSNLAFNYLHLWPLLAVLGALLGVIGAIFVKKKRVLSGVLFILAALLNIIIYSFILYTLAAIFALVKDKASSTQVKS